jgi:hypothetical protein
MPAALRPRAPARPRDRSAAAGAAATWRDVTFLSRITSTAGMDCAPPYAITLANIATVSIDFTRRDSRGELPVLEADEPITSGHRPRLTT